MEFGSLGSCCSISRPSLVNSALKSIFMKEAKESSEGSSWVIHICGVVKAANPVPSFSRMQYFRSPKQANGRDALSELSVRL